LLFATLLGSADVNPAIIAFARFVTVVALIVAIPLEGAAFLAALVGLILASIGLLFALFKVAGITNDEFFETRKSA
jgi:hypothetical protein